MGNIPDEWVEYLRPLTIFGRLENLRDIPRRTKKAWRKKISGRRLTVKEQRRCEASKGTVIRKVPFTVKIVAQESDTYWVTDGD